MKKLQIYSLAKEIDGNSIYSDSTLTRADMSEILNKSRSTITKWSAIAWVSVPDYRFDFPEKEDGSRDTCAALMPYQTWVLSRIDYLMERFKNRQRAESYIKANKILFSKQRFDHLTNLINEAIAS
jgi:hypothetical protein